MDGRSKTLNDLFMNRDTITRNIIMPALMPVLFFAVALSPVDLLGCRTRGLIASLLALASGLAGVGTGVLALKGRTKNEAGSERWLFTTLILVIPVAALLVLA